MGAPGGGGQMSLGCALMAASESSAGAAGGRARVDRTAWRATVSGPPMQLAANDAPTHFRSSAARPGGISLIVTAFREAWSRRRLIRYLVRADIKRLGTDTLIGNLW